MGTTLRQFLHGLCSDSPWSYAVFWKLQHPSQMLLTWEDGYWDIPRPRESKESIFRNVCFAGPDDTFSSKCESSIYDGSVGGDPIGLAMAYMSSVQYVLGDGVVGEVAFTGNYSWVFSDNKSSGDNNFLSAHSQHPNEWLFQFSAGVKTLLLVPVIPHGVLQLGSLETVAEDLALVSYIKDRFYAYQNLLGFSQPLIMTGEFLAPSSLSLMSNVRDSLDSSSTLTMKDIKCEDLKVVDSGKTRSHSVNQIPLPCQAHDSSNICRKDMQKIVNATENNVGTQLGGLCAVSESSYESLNSNNLETMKNSMFRSPYVVEEFEASYISSYNMGVFEEYANKTMDRYFYRGMVEQPSADKNASHTCHKDVKSYFSFPSDSELHKALGPVVRGQADEYLSNTFISDGDEDSISGLICNGDIIYDMGPSAQETSGQYAKGDDAEPLLEAVVANTFCDVDENSSNITNSVKSSTTSSGQFAASSKEQSQCERSVVVGDNRQGPVRSPFVDRCRNSVTNSSPSISSIESVMSALIEEEHEKKYGYPHLRKGSKLSSATKRRARTNDNKKPRPRDRQLIQDRVKELRELVPKGSKCSIDGLLDLTIKHMLYLRSATEQAHKLKQCVHPEVIPSEAKSPAAKGDRPTGKSWALESESEQQTCPIVVEDLECPGHMLIEMLCSNHGRFLEIADVIRRLELTILKGAMERRRDNLWAHFIIEAPKGYHRLDIFWPLMQLLQQN